MSAKPPKPLKKIEDLRVNRKSSGHGHVGGGESWAISYADMLMVLLSFFVMFFSLKDESPATFDDQLKKISLSMKTLQEQNAALKDAGHAPASVGSGTPEADGAKDFSDLTKALKIEGVTITTEKNQLVLTLDDTAFQSGSFEPDKKILSRVDQIVAGLKPFEQSVQLTIVGHTDKRRLIPRGKYLTDNFDLSSFRALKVLKHVFSRGFPENRASARAASSFDREARSVSIVIQLTDATKPGTGV